MRRLFCSVMFYNHCLWLAVLYVFLNDTPVVLAQNAEAKPSPKAHNPAALAVGSFVAPISSDIVLQDDGRQVVIREYLAVKVDRIDGDRLLEIGRAHV